MIHSLSIKNFLSFKEEVKFSFEASKEEHLEEQHVVEVADGVRLLKLAIVYGYNASGKTNLVNAFEFLRDFWFNQTEDKDEFVEIMPFMLDHESRHEASIFKLVFYIDGIKYVYTLHVHKHFVFLETLDFYPSTQPANIFTRSYDGKISIINYGAKIKINSAAKKEIEFRCLTNTSFFAAYNQVNTQIEEAEKVISWMKNNVMQAVTPLSKLQEFTENLISTNSSCKKSVLSYLQNADFNVNNISSEKLKHIANDEVVTAIKEIFNTDLLGNEFDNLFNTKKIATEFEHSVIHNGKKESFKLPINSQSDGTKRIFGLAGFLFNAIEKNALLPIDEIESKLHPRLIEYVIESFLRESKQAQLLLTTHYDNLFDEDDLLRKDNFWFAEKGEDAGTKLYPLSGFNGLSRISSLQKAYKYGKFGATPDID
jgi:AAA15 family ATPase/GTPase